MRVISIRVTEEQDEIISDFRWENRVPTKSEIVVEALREFFSNRGIDYPTR